MEVRHLKFINCVKLGDILGVTRHQAGFILKYLESIGLVILHNERTSRRYNYKIINIDLLEKTVEQIRNRKLKKELNAFRVKKYNHTASAIATGA